MSLFGLMRTSASGMAVQADRLGAVSDNIANVNTNGYKRASLEFSTLVLDSGVKSYESGSVEPNIRRAISEQGAFSYTKSVSDLAIKGDGYFLVSDNGGQVYLTRAGSFVQSSDGRLVNAAGYTLMGYPLTGGGPPPAVANGTAGLEPVTIGTLSLLAAPSTSGSFYVNMDSNAAIVAPADLPSGNLATSQYSAKTSLSSYDNLGNLVTLDVYTAKTAAGQWEVSVYDKSTADPSGGFPYTAAPLATQTLLFDNTTGQLDPTSATSISIPIPNGSTIQLDMSKSSQYAASYSVLEAHINGNEASAVKLLEVASDGTVYGVYDSGARVATYKIPLANVQSPDNMMVFSGNLFQPNSNSGDMLIGFPETDGFGSMVSGAVEKSTVDLATELTIMIEAEKNYTANSKVFQTGADLMDVLVNLKR